MRARVGASRQVSEVQVYNFQNELNLAVWNDDRMFGAQLGEAHAESIGLPPCDAAGAGGPEIIETQFK